MTNLFAGPGTLYAQGNLDGIAFLLYSCFLFMAVAIAAMVLGTACKIARVEPPEFFGAMGIVLIANVVVFVVQLMFAAVIAVGTGETNIRSVGDLQKLLMKTAPFIGLLYPFIVAGIYSVMLRECSYLKALLILVLQVVVVIVFAGAFIAVAYVFMKK